MFLKKKNIPVIIFSVVIIATVFLSSILLFSMYYLWKEKKAFRNYDNSIYAITASLFNEYIAVSDILIVPGEKGKFGGRPLIEGRINNNTGKTISSVLMEVSFVDDAGSVVYKHRFHPFGTGPGNKDVGSPLLYPLINSTDNMLLPGDSISFRHMLGNCNNSLVERIKNVSRFDQKGIRKDLKAVFVIVGLSVL